MSDLTVEEIKDEKENKTIAGISTVVILSLLFVLLLFLMFGSSNSMDALEGGGGVAVSLGEPDAGGPSQEASAPQTKSTKSSQEQVDDPILSQDDDNAPVVRKTTEKTTEKKEKKVDDDLSDILGGLPNRKKTNGTGDGSNPGNKGRTDGADGANGEDGTGTTGKGPATGPGNGGAFSIGGSLKGRKISQAPPKSNDFYTNGTVTLKITVNSSGKVTSARVSRPSSNDVKLQQLAKDLAYKAKFEPKFGAPDQTGTITFNFKL